MSRPNVGVAPRGASDVLVALTVGVLSPRQTGPGTDDCFDMQHIYMETAGPHDWQWLLAKPALHWKRGASAMALAEAWEGAESGWPSRVAAALNAGGFADLELLAAFPSTRRHFPAE